jgi:hypothetical protein
MVFDTNIIYLNLNEQTQLTKKKLNKCYAFQNKYLGYKKKDVKNVCHAYHILIIITFVFLKTLTKTQKTYQKGLDSRIEHHIVCEKKEEGKKRK